MKRKIIASLALLLWTSSTFPWASLNYHDALPLISPVYPWDFLNSEIKANYAHDQMKEISERVQFSVNLFMETTNYANNQDGIQVVAGDLYGRIGLLAMCYGSVPKGQKESTLLATIADTPFTFVDGNMDSTEFADPMQDFGFLKNPLQYRKAGVRFNGSCRLLENFVISVYAGACDMRQSITGLEDQTFNANLQAMGGDSADVGEVGKFNDDKFTVYNDLVRQWQEVFTQIGAGYSDWHEIGIEDATLSLTYRCNIPIQQGVNKGSWTQFLIIPHVTVSFTGAFGETRNPDELLSLPFGNNGHNALSVEAGLALAFNDTIEVFGGACITQFASKIQNMRVPTSSYQSGFYPYKTSVKYSPSNIYTGTFGLNAHYFIDRLSGYVQIEYAGHEEDNIQLIQNDPAYDVARLMADTEWKYGAVNVGLNYDLSPNISLGGAAQLPMGRKGSYLTNTFMLGMTGTF